MVSSFSSSATKLDTHTIWHSTRAKNDTTLSVPTEVVLHLSQPETRIVGLSDGAHVNDVTILLSLC